MKADHRRSERRLGNRRWNPLDYQRIVTAMGANSGHDAQARERAVQIGNPLEVLAGAFAPLQGDNLTERSEDYAITSGDPGRD